VVLDLGEGAAVIGAVVDQATRQPAPEASARLAVMAEDDPAATVGETIVGPDGRFRLVGAWPGSTGLIVSAPGYGKQTRRLLGEPPTIDVGTIALTRAQPLEVCLVGNALFDPGAFVLSSDDGRIQPVGFGDDGCLVLPEFGAGPLSFDLRLPDGGLISGSTHLRSGEDWRLEIPLDGLSSVLVDFEASAAAPAEMALIVSHELVPGFEIQRSVLLDTLQPVSIEGIPRTPVTATLREVGGPVLGTASGRFEEGQDPLRLTIRLDERVHRFRVLDASGTPLAGAQLYVAPGGDVVGVTGLTDADGSCALRGFSDGELFGMVQHARGVRPSVPIDGDADGVQVIVVDPSSALELSVEEDGVPVAAANCLLVDPKVWRVIAGPVDSDAKGRVVFPALNDGAYHVQVRASGKRADLDVVVQGRTMRVVGLSD